MATTKKPAASKTKAPAAHGSYRDMIKTAIVQLKERTGSSRIAIKKYVLANNDLGSTSDAALSKHINQAITSGVTSGDFVQPKGPSGTVKLQKKGTAAASAAAAPKATTTTKTTTAKKPAAKKAPAKKTTTKTTTTKAAPKKTTTKSTTTKTKANTAKPRKTTTTKKTPAAAPAIEEKPVTLGKTKSGRVTKSTAPPAVKRAVAPNKAKAPKKKATAKKT